MERESKSDNRHLVEFIRELAQQEGISFHEAVGLVIKTIREHQKALGQKPLTGEEDERFNSD